MDGDSGSAAAGALPAESEALAGHDSDDQRGVARLARERERGPACGRAASNLKGVEGEVQRMVDAVGFGRFQAMLFVICGLGWAADVAVIFGGGLLLPVLKQEFGVASDAQLGLVGSSTFLGLLLGAFGFGLAADSLGRARVWFFTSFGTFALGLALAATRSFGEFVAVRFLVGVFLGGNLPVDFALFLEWTPSAQRDMATIALTGWSIFATLFATLLGSLTLRGEEPQWRAFLLATAALSALTCACRPFVPESPRFLAVNGRLDECSKALQYVAAMNKCQTPSDALAFDLDLDFPDANLGARARARDAEPPLLSTPTSRPLDDDSGATDDCDGDGDDTGRLISHDPDSDSVSVSVSDDRRALGPRRTLRSRSRCARLRSRLGALLLADSVHSAPSPLRATTALLAAVWFASSVGFYAFATFAPTMMADASSEDVAYSVLLTTLPFQAVGLGLAVLGTKTLGPAPTLCGFLVLDAAAVLVFAVVTATATATGESESESESESGESITGAAAAVATPGVAGMFVAYALFNVGAAGLFGVLYLFTNLCFPTEIRATGFGLCSAANRLGGVLAPVSAGALYAAVGTAACVGFAAAFAVAAAAAWILHRRHTRLEV